MEKLAQKKGTFLFVAGVLTVLVIAFSFQNISSGMDQRQALEAVKGRFASVEHYESSLVLPSLLVEGRGGRRVNFDDFRGRFVLLNIWASWCSPCIAELPTLQSLKQHYRGAGLEVIAVSIDSQKDIKGIEVFLQKHKIGAVGLFHDFQDDIQKAFSFKSLPVSFLISPDGRVLYKVTGPADWDHPDIINFLDIVQKTY